MQKQQDNVPTFWGMEIKMSVDKVLKQVNNDLSTDRIHVHVQWQASH